MSTNTMHFVLTRRKPGKDQKHTLIFLGNVIFVGFVIVFGFFFSTIMSSKNTEK